MIALIGRYLHQPINDVLEWETDEFVAYYQEAIAIIGAENRRS